MVQIEYESLKVLSVAHLWHDCGILHWSQYCCILMAKQILSCLFSFWGRVPTYTFDSFFLNYSCCTLWYKMTHKHRKDAIYSLILSVTPLKNNLIQHSIIHAGFNFDKVWLISFQLNRNWTGALSFQTM